MFSNCVLAEYVIVDMGIEDFVLYSAALSI